MAATEKFNKFNALAILIALLCVGAIVVAYIMSHQLRDNDFEKNVNALNDLQRLDAAWSLAILKTRDNVLLDFDETTSYLDDIQNAFKTLEAGGMLDKERAGKSTVNRYQSYKHAFAAKREAAEHYKSQQAILRNSVRYIPQSGDALLQTLQSDASKESGSFANVQSLLYRFILLPEVPEDQVSQQLAGLKKLSLNEVDTLDSRVDDYLTHANLILKHKNKANERLQTAISNKTAGLSAEVLNKYLAFKEGINTRIDDLQKLMLAAGVILLGLVGWFVSRLQKSSAKITRAEQEKDETNEQLASTREEMDLISQQMAESERWATAGKMAIDSLRMIKPVVGGFDNHSKTIQHLKSISTGQEEKKAVDALMTDMNYVKINFDELSSLIESEETSSQAIITFDLNTVAAKAVDSIESDLEESATFIKQLGKLPKIEGSPIDLHQIVTRLLEQAGQACERGSKKGRIFLKTWSTDHSVNLAVYNNGLITPESDAEAEETRELIEANFGSLRFTNNAEKASNMAWASFPLTPQMDMMEAMQG